MKNISDSNKLLKSRLPSRIEELGSSHFLFINVVIYDINIKTN